MIDSISSAEYRRLVGQPDELPTEMDAAAYRALIAGGAPSPRPHSSETDTEPPAKRDFADWLDLVSPYPVEREHTAIPGRRFRFDWSIGDPLFIAIEYDGFTDHTSLRGVLRDSEKSNLAQLNGWLFLRVNARSIGDGSAHQIVERAIAERLGGEL